VAVKIRLARGGAKKAPYYRVVVANATAPRDGDFLEKVGTYDPMLKAGDAARVKLKNDRVIYWLSQGAQPTEKVIKFLQDAGIALPAAIAKKVAIQKKNHEAMAAKRAQEAKAKADAEAAEKAKADAEAAAVEKAKADAEAAAAAAAVDVPSTSQDAPVVEETSEEKPSEEAPKE